MKSITPERELRRLKLELEQVRKASLAATQRGDFRTVGRLTCQAAHINQTIQEVEGLMLEAA